MEETTGPEEPLEKETPSKVQEAASSLDRVLHQLPEDIRYRVLEATKRAGITKDDDVLFQIIEILGIYASYFETVPTRLAESIEHKLGRLEIIATHIQKTAGDDYEQLKEEGVALITSLQEFVILTQSVKEETNAALQRTSGHLQELSESFSKEIKEQIVSKTLDELVEKVRTTLQASQASLDEALRVHREASDEISRNTTTLLAASRSQMEDAHDLSVERVRKRLLALSFFWGAGIAVVFLTIGWFILQARFNGYLGLEKERWEQERQSLWELETKDMEENKEILQKLSEKGILLRFVRQGDKNYVVIPGAASSETEHGTYIELPVEPKTPKLD